MDPIIKAIKQDLTAALQYFRTRNFEFLGKMGDRVMSNLLIAQEKDLMIMGYLVKEVAREFISIKEEDPVRLNGCMDAGKQFIQDMLDSIPSEGKLDPAVVWEDYYNYKKKIVEFIPTDVELAVYEKDPEFAGMASQRLKQILDENRGLLLEDHNNLLRGLLDEQRRIINIYGFEKTDLMFYILLRAFLEYYWYMLAFKMVNKLEGEAISDKIYYYVDKITKLPVGFEEMSRKSSEILGELGYQTRTFYIENMDPEKTIRRERGY